MSLPKFKSLAFSFLFFFLVFPGSVEAGVNPGHKVLIVDDDPNDIFFRTRRWRKMDFDEIDSCGSGEEAYRKLVSAYENQKPYTVIASDLKMPRIDGLGLLKRVRLDSRFENLPFIIASDTRLEDVRSDYLREFQRFRLTAFVPKSADLRELKEVVHSTVVSMGDKDQWERLELILQQAKIRKHELASRLARVGLKKMAAQEIEFQKAIDLLLKEAQLNIAGLTVSSDNRDAAWRALDLFLGRLEALIDDLELYNSLPEDRRDMRELIYTRARIRIASLVKNLVQTTLECQRFLGLEH